MIDASVAVTASELARSGAVEILTSGPGDLRLLGAVLNSGARLVSV